MEYLLCFMLLTINGVVFYLSRKGDSIRRFKILFIINLTLTLIFGGWLLIEYMIGYGISDSSNSIEPTFHISKNLYIVKEYIPYFFTGAILTLIFFSTWEIKKCKQKIELPTIKK